MKPLRKFIDVCRNEGVALAVNKGVAYVGNSATTHIKEKLGFEDPVFKRRKQLSVAVSKMFGSTVTYGPFKGLKFLPDSWWGAPSRASMLLGLYEQEVLQSLAGVSKKYTTFIDLGAADGYYGIGVLVSGLFRHSYCFEISEQGREIIRENARINGVSDCVSIQGIADKDFYKAIKPDELAQSVLFVDIEGGEFDLFDRDIFRIFKDSVIFIELHEWLVEDGERKLVQLRKDAEAFFTVTELTTTARDLSPFKELKNFSDTDRWLMCSEGRGRLMRWYRLDPKN